MSKVETNTIDTVSGSSTMQIGSTNTTTINLGVSGDTVNIPSGVTLANAGTATGFGITGWSSSSGSLLPASASAGIYLGVNSATASNLLDDYEEGTWTASVIVDSGSMTLESAFNTGSYVKIGNIVNVQGFFKVDSTSAGSGYIGISGLPFTSASLSEGADSSVGACFVRNASSTIGGGVICWIETNGQTLTALRENGTTGVGNTLTSYFDSGTDFTLNVTYRTT